MDKQKQIEEMAKDMLDYGMEGYPTFDSVFTETKLREQLFNVFLGYAERLIKKGYRKIPENAVVLTDEKDIQQFEWSKLFDKMGVIEFGEKLRKEMAMAFLFGIESALAYYDATDTFSKEWILAVMADIGKEEGVLDEDGKLKK